MSTREAARAQSSEGARSRGYPSGRGSIAWQASKQPTSASTSCRSGGKRPASHAPTCFSPAASLASVAPAAGAGGGGGGRAPSSWRSLTLVAYLGKQNKGTKGCRQGLSGARAAPLLLAASHTEALVTEVSLVTAVILVTEMSHRSMPGRVTCHTRPSLAQARISHGGPPRSACL